MMQKQLQRDEVYRWFGELNSSQRVDFICGLLDLCIPLELRFLGSCLEDLAKKDYHSLRDSEIKANNVADLASLTNMTDEVVRSKLIVSLALLCSDNREASGVLYRTLTHIDSIINNYGLQLHDRTGDEFLLLFTMASNHPSFTFHQKQVLRQELLEIQRIIDSTSNTRTVPVTAPTPVTTTTNWDTSSAECKVMYKVESSVHCLENALQTSAHSCDESSQKRPSGKHSRITIERIDVRGLQHKKNEKTAEYYFEVLWSDSSMTLITKTYRELREFLLKLPQMFPGENLENSIPETTNHDCCYTEERKYSDLEPYLRYLISLPSHVLKNDYIQKFFCTAIPNHSVQHLNTNSIPVMLHKANTSTGAAVRPICGVASIQCSYNTVQPSIPASSCSHSVSGSSAPVTWPHTENLNPQNPEQIGILDWLKKLRLHKYYPVFKQLTMDKFLSLTEEDLNKFETLTLGAKKKLKMQLELEKEKSEKRNINSTGQSPVSSAGIARVTPTSHFGPIHSIRCIPNAELRVEVEQHSRMGIKDSGSSSEYSSSPSSPIGIQGREESSDSADENDRHPENTLDIQIKEKPAMLSTHLSNLNTGSWRPTAQVSPVQNETGLAHPSHVSSAVSTVQFMPVISSNIAPSRMLNSVRKSERGSFDMKPITGVSSPIHASSSVDLGSKLHEGPASSFKVEKKFASLGAMVVDVMPTSPLQASQISTSVMENSGIPSKAVNFGIRTKVGPPSMDSTPKTTPLTLPKVDTSSSTTTSNPAYNLPHAPMKLLVSSSIPTESMLVGQTAYNSVVQVKSVSPAVISSRTVPYSANTKVAFSTMQCSPVTSISGPFCANNNNAPANSHSSVSFTNIVSVPNCPIPSSSPTLSSVAENSYINSNNGSGGSGMNVPMQQQQQQTGCNVCSSCGCSGNCGSNPVTINYANYFQSPFSGHSVLTFPIFPFNPLCNSGYISTQYNNGTAFPYPVVPPPAYNTGLTPDSILSGQSNFVMPPMQNFLGGTTAVYQTQNMLGSTNGPGHKKNGHISCYNCGANGHRAQDCKQPAMDSNQQGTFRLKYAPPSERMDSAD
ncbi:zinc finger CCHC domain-containing protein 14 isoform X1 [Hemiscyllium ocellatum]|uniref:zinc finger CCHC domain-containing protein 14 isoform X1 n=1 Tax=Hemiscyllium ocellatum TaxID=170820 RepID=UPI00296724B7|nr:zinc finger CCHC domain-containing protein 14 isoform X1 [Hemiscyllium ocellatum]